MTLSYQRKRLADFAVLPGIERSLVNLRFLAPNPHIFLLFGLDVLEKPRGARVLRTQQERVLERFAGVAVRMVVHVLARQLHPFLDLPIVPPSLDFAAQPERGDVAGIELEHFLQLLERERILGLFKARACAVEELGDRLLPYDLIDLRP